jgi:4-hydroxy-tetrahydrodipicolinate synthase
MRKISFFGKKETVSLLNPRAISGLIVPLLTPLNEDKSVDVLALKTITARMMNKGVKNFFVLSDFSEQEFLSEEERKKVIQTVFDCVKGKGFLLIGCFGSSVDEVIDRVNEAVKYSPICVVNVPASQIGRELEFVDFFDSLFTKTSANILIYNNPALFKQNIPSLWLDNIINWEKLIGIIDYNRNPEYLDDLSKYYQFTKLFECNADLSFDALRKGFVGLCCASSNLAPSYYLQLIDGYNDIDFKQLIRTEAKISAFNKIIPQTKKIQAFKYALYLNRYMKPFFSNSLEELTDKEKRLIEDAFAPKKTISLQNESEN